MKAELSEYLKKFAENGKVENKTRNILNNPSHYIKLSTESHHSVKYFM